jgi:hypothetical protein
MRVYHERLYVPWSWWLVGLATIAILATEVVPGWPIPVEWAIYLVLVGAVAGLLLNWSRPSIDVGDGELRVVKARLPLAAVGEVTALDEVQTRSLRGPRGDPAAFLIIRPYLKQAVYIEVTGPGQGRRGGSRPRRSRSRPPAPPAPYWLIGTRHPAQLAAAINGARPAARADGATVG